MKILLINHYAGSPELGMEYRPWYLAHEWQKQGHEVTVLAGDYSHLRRNNPAIRHDFLESEVEGVKFVWLKSGTYKGNGSQRAFSMLRFVGKLWRHARKIATTEKPDVVIGSSTYPMDSYAAARIAKLARCPYIHEVHDMWPASLTELGGMSEKHPFVRLVAKAERYAARHADGIVSLLAHNEEHFRQLGFKGKWVWIPNGIDPEDWKGAEILPEEHRELLEKLRHEKKFIALYFGGHALSNALDSLLNAASLNGDQNIVFVLVGDGVEKMRLQERAKNEGISNVLFLPAIRKKAIPSLLKYADISLVVSQTSKLYRFGTSLNKVFDSMAAGLPIVSTLNEPDSLLTKIGCGVICEDNAAETILRCVQQLKNMQTEDLLKMGETGKSYIWQQGTYLSRASIFSHFMETLRG